MLETTINYATVLAYIALSVDVIFQIHKIWVRKSSADVSIPGVVIRTTAIGVFLVKFTLLKDMIIIAGQSVFLLLMAVYIVLLVTYRDYR